MLSPVRGLVVDPALAPEVIAPAYDALTPDERDAWAAAHPRSWLNCTRRSVDGSPAAERAIMAVNRAALEHLLASGTFAHHRPALYLHRLTDADHRQTAVIGQLPVDVIGTPALRGHEGVHPGRVETLRLQLEIVGATSSPVAVTWRSDEDVDGALDTATTTAPLVDVVDHDGIRHQLWPVADEAVPGLTAALDSGPLYVIDGHHRSAAAAAFAASREPRSEHDRHLLVAAFPRHHLRVAPFHRVLHADVDVSQLDGAQRIAEPTVQRGVAAVHDARGAWWQIDLGTGPGELDVERLHSSVLEARLGVGADDRALEHVAGRGGLDELAARAAGATAFALAPVELDEILDRADEGRVMPPKATYFHPKVRSGLLVRLHVPGDERIIA